MNGISNMMCNNSWSLSAMTKQQFYGPYLFTSAATWTCEHAGDYMVIVVGAPGESCYVNSNYGNCNTVGASGGVAIKYSTFDKGSQHTVEVTKSSASAGQSCIRYSFDTDLYADGGTSAYFPTYTHTLLPGIAGMGYGGDYNYAGEVGTVTSSFDSAIGKSVGVYIPGLMESVSSGHSYFTSTYAYNSGTTASITNVTIESGKGILGYGASCGSYVYTDRGSNYGVTAGKNSGCVLIIPIDVKTD